MNPKDQQDAIWDYFQNEAPEQFAGSLSRIQYLLRSIKPGDKVLNIGVGSGILEKLAIDAGIEIYALDPIDKSIENLKTRLNMGDNARTGYGEAIPFEDGMFDYVIASEVLEHLSDESIAATLPEIRRVLKPGGKFIGTVPARENLADQIVVCPDCKKRFHRWGHQQSFTIERMKKTLQPVFSEPLVVEKLFIPFNIMNYKGKVTGLIKVVLFHLGQHGSNENVYFEAAKSRT